MRRSMKAMLFAILLQVFVLQAGYAADIVIAEGKKVQFDYTLTVDGQVIDTTEGKQPIEFVQGDGTIIPGLARQMEGLKAGDVKSVTVAAEDGYGQVTPDAIKEVPKAVFPKDAEIKVGQVYEFQGEGGAGFPGIVSEIKEQAILMNFNHPLAGKELKFDIKVVKVE